MSGEPAAWLSTRERGTLLGIRVAFRLALCLGRRATKPMVAIVALWYLLTDRAARSASRDWLTRVYGAPPNLWSIYRHLRTFAQVTLDKVFLLTDRTASLRIGRTGHELLLAQSRSGRGAMLLGAHLGSYEAMRVGGDEEGFAIDVVGHFANARMINALLADLNPRLAARLLHSSDDPIGIAVQVSESLAEGRFVACMGDRVGWNDRAVCARFFGAEAAFPAGPFLMAAALRCPVYLVFGLYSPPNRYALRCERFAEKIELPRKQRAAALEEWVQRYADRVAHHAREAPLNWFNFFDFWAAPSRSERALRLASRSPMEKP